MSKGLIPRIPVLLAFFLPLAVYTLTLAPSVTLEDSAEYASAAKVLGLAHPPGSPTWVLLAHTMNFIPIGSFIQRTNFLSALCVSAGMLFLFLFLRDQTRRWDLALAASGVAAFSQCIWGQAVVTYNYSLNLMTVLLCLFLAGRWRLTSHRRWLIATALMGGLGAGVHHLFILVSPAILLWALWGKVREAFAPKTVIACTAALLLGLSVFLYLPIRSAQNPPLAWGKVDSFAAFKDYLSRRVYKEAEGGIWYSGKMKDGLHFMGAFVKGLPREQGGLLALFALPGIVFLWKANRGLFGVLAGILIFNVPVLLSMGGSQFTPTSEYINRLYYLPATAAWAVFTVAGWRGVIVHYLSPSPKIGRGGRGVRVVSALVLCAPLFPLALNWRACDRSHYWIAHEYGENLLRSLPSGAGVFPLTNNETFLLLYFRFVEGDRRALLLDKRFGWDEAPPTGGVFTAWDVGKSAVRPVPTVLGEAETLPSTLLYQAVTAEPLQGLERFRLVRPVKYEISSLPPDYPFLSPFERMIFAGYSAYYSGLGARLHLENKPDLRDKAWQRAEELNPGDPYCHYLLGQLYEESCARPREAATAHYQKALELFDLVYDPLDTRFYGVTKEMIEKALTSP
jgi:hypothetical protein